MPRGGRPSSNRVPVHAMAPMPSPNVRDLWRAFLLPTAPPAGAFRGFACRKPPSPTTMHGRAGRQLDIDRLSFLLPHALRVATHSTGARLGALGRPGAMPSMRWGAHWKKAHDEATAAFTRKQVSHSGRGVGSSACGTASATPDSNPSRMLSLSPAVTGYPLQWLRSISGRAPTPS